METRQSVQNFGNNLQQAIAIIAGALAQKRQNERFDAARQSAIGDMRQTFDAQQQQVQDAAGIGQAALANAAVGQPSAPMVMPPREPFQTPDVMAVLAHMIQNDPRITQNPNFAPTFNAATLMAPRYSQEDPTKDVVATRPGGMRSIVRRGVPKVESTEDWLPVMSGGVAQTIKAGDKDFVKLQKYVNGKPVPNAFKTGSPADRTDSGSGGRERENAIAEIQRLTNANFDFGRKMTQADDDLRENKIAQPQADTLKQSYQKEIAANERRIAELNAKIGGTWGKGVPQQSQPATAQTATPQEAQWIWDEATASLKPVKR